MPDVTFIAVNGAAQTVSVPAGETVMRAAMDANIDAIKADCGGALTCATCHVHVAPEWRERVGPPGEDEVLMLELAVDPAEDSRLCCQITMDASLDGLVVNLPASQY